MDIFLGGRATLLMLCLSSILVSGTQSQSSLRRRFPRPRNKISHHRLQGQYGYSPQQIRRAMKPSARTPKTNDKPTSTAYIPYTQKTFGRLSRMLAKQNIKSVALPPRKISSYFPPAKSVHPARWPLHHFPRPALIGTCSEPTLTSI